MRRAALAAAAVAAAGCTVASAALAQDHMAMGGHGSGPGTGDVTIGFASFTPAREDVLVGDTVTWHNESVRAHTVTADDAGSFDSGRLAAGSTFAHRFTTPGAFAYHCTLHAGMTGEIDAHVLLLSAPAPNAAPDRRFPLSGRAALPAGSSVEIRADTGAGASTVATTTVGDDGTFAADVTPAASTTYRAVAGGQASPPVKVLVLDHHVTVRVTRARHGAARVTATVRPAAPGQDVVLQAHLRDRFGWWPLQHHHLDRASRARFTVHLRRRTPLRVRLTLPDEATPLATSRTVHAGPVRRHRR
jgi:plastocyanin